MTWESANAARSVDLLKTDRRFERRREVGQESGVGDAVQRSVVDRQRQGAGPVVDPANSKDGGPRRVDKRGEDIDPERSVIGDGDVPPPISSEWSVGELVWWPAEF